MSYKLIGFDLDGTLLNCQHDITISTLELIKALKDRGVTIVINTGRSFNACIYYAKLIQADYVIGCNGAFIYHCKDETIDNPYPIEGSIAYKIIEMLYNYADEIKIQWDSMDTYYSNNITSFERNYIQNYQRDFPNDIFNFKIIDNKEDIKAIQHEEIFQVFFHPIGRDKSTYYSILDDLKMMKDVSLMDFSKEYTDINHMSVSKGKALENLASKLEIPSKDILVFGDGNNDISMFQYAGYAIAMENACDELKEIAHGITNHHDEEGIAQALSKIYNLKGIHE
ncbi:MAG: Cof-type HAD-IIB family hydrolase [Eubacteriales bacterium]